MYEKMSDRVIRRAGWGRAAVGALLSAAGVGAASGCVSDADIPDCLRTHRCNVEGQAGEGESGNLGLGSSGAGGTGEGGRVANGGGSGSPTPGVTSGGQANEPSAGAGGDGAGGDGAGCADCGLFPAELVPACADRSYRSTLHAIGGLGPYTWQILPPVQGWSVAPVPGEPARAVLEADSVDAGTTTISVRITDARGLEYSQTFVAQARDSCWFAYTATTSEGSRLALLDSLSEDAELASLQHNTAVYDFQFSPDGRYLAYRYGADQDHPQGRHLSLLNLSTLAETALTFGEDAVSAYAWSPSGAVLAVGFSKGSGSFLGGARTSASGGPSLLSSVPAPIERTLVWVGNSGVAFDVVVSTEPGRPRAASYAGLLASSFGPPQTPDEVLDPESLLVAGEDGFWTVESNMRFFATAAATLGVVPHYGAELLSPSGKFSAWLDGGSLDVWAAGAGVLNEPFATSEDCPMPLAWSRQERIACVADIENGAGLGTHGVVRLLDLESSGTLATTELSGFCTDDTSSAGDGSCTATRDGYGYGTALAVGAPRRFSESGRWFAFTRAVEEGAYAYVADLTASTPSPISILHFPSVGAPGALGFSPDEQRLALQVGSSLIVRSLGGSSREVWITDELAPAGSCTEDLPTASRAFCGDTPVEAGFKWSPDSLAVAYRSGEALTVADLSAAAGFTEFPMPLPGCQLPTCSGGFEFQPLTLP